MATAYCWRLCGNRSSYFYLSTRSCSHSAKSRIHHPKRSFCLHATCLHDRGRLPCALSWIISYLDSAFHTISSSLSIACSVGNCTACGHQFCRLRTTKAKGPGSIKRWQCFRPSTIIMWWCRRCRGSDDHLSAGCAEKEASVQWPAWLPIHWNGGCILENVERGRFRILLSWDVAKLSENDSCH